MIFLSHPHTINGGFFSFFFVLYFIVNMSYKIQYISMHLLQSKHTLHNLSSNLSVHVVKRFQPKVGSNISFTL